MQAGGPIVRYTLWNARSHEADMLDTRLACVQHMAASDYLSQHVPNSRPRIEKLNVLFYKSF